MEMRKSISNYPDSNTSDGKYEDLITKSKVGRIGEEVVRYNKHSQLQILELFQTSLPNVIFDEHRLERGAYNPCYWVGEPKVA